jgi:serine/threonine protein kinase/tetratricopeptide (TPR) repeat protein
MALTAGAKLGPYEIISPLGKGGMGEVYLARDARLGRDVAIKVLPADGTTDEGRRKRFIHEARAASALNHPNIVTIYEIESANGIDFIVMEYLPGETLNRLIPPRGMSLKEVLKIAIPIANALARAHRQGIVHRDVKPANVVVGRDGMVKVLDFGLAKLVSRAAMSPDDETFSAGDASPLSRPGTIAGTVGYMSPEQATGRGADARSDVFGFGAVLYEMVTGRRAFAGRSVAETMTAVIRDQPKAPTEVVHGVPKELERLILRCLQKDADKRFQDAQDIGIELEEIKHELESQGGSSETKSHRKYTPGSLSWVRASVINRILGRSKGLGLRSGFFPGALALAVTAFVVYLTLQPKAIASLAVLPFVNQSGNPDAEYMSDGITESIINNVSGLAHLRVIARGSVFRYKGRDVDPANVGRELRVRAILQGQVKQLADDILISAELIDTKDSRHLWGEKYIRKFADIFQVQDEIASNISKNLRLKLSGDETARLTKRYTEDPAAYELYLKGRYLLTRHTREASENALGYFQQAIARDPRYALAYSGLADGYYDRSNSYLPPADAIPLARAAALKALELDDSLAEAHTSLGLVKMYYDWDWVGAGREFRKAIELKPGYASAHHWYAYYLAELGQLDQALREIEKARELDPLSVYVITGAAQLEYLARNYDRTATYAMQAIELDDGAPGAHIFLGMAYLTQGRTSEAVSELEKAWTLDDGGEVAGWVGYVYGKLGRHDKATEVLHKMRSASHRFIPAYSIAMIHAGLEETDAAFEWLASALEDRSEGMAWLNVDPRLEELRSDPRFEELVRRVGLPARDQARSPRAPDPDPRGDRPHPRSPR